MSSFCICKSYSHFFSKNTCELDTVLSRTVNNLTTNKLVNLRTLWTTGPCLLSWTPVPPSKGYSLKVNSFLLEWTPCAVRNFFFFFCVFFFGTVFILENKQHHGKKHLLHCLCMVYEGHFLMKIHGYIMKGVVICYFFFFFFLHKTNIVGTLEPSWWGQCNK